MRQLFQWLYRRGASYYSYSYTICNQLKQYQKLFMWIGSFLYISVDAVHARIQFAPTTRPTEFVNPSLACAAVPLSNIGMGNRIKPMKQHFMTRCLVILSTQITAKSSIEKHGPASSQRFTNSKNRVANAV